MPQVTCVLPRGRVLTETVSIQVIVVAVLRISIDILPIYIYIYIIVVKLRTVLKFQSKTRVMQRLLRCWNYGREFLYAKDLVYRL